MSDGQTLLTLGGADYEVSRSRLGQFLELQVASIDLSEAIKRQHAGQAEKAIYRYIATVIPDLEHETFAELPWQEVISAFLRLEHLNRIRDSNVLAILKYPPRESAPRPPWHYPRRLLVLWIHMIADAYHWSKSEIENLWPEEAAAFIQEILASEHERREFSYSLSRVAYAYNRATKKSEYRALPAPEWMMAAKMDRPKPVTKLRKDGLPMGQVLYPKGEELEH